ncbi:hypothetical protein [Clostridium beijerinckii]|nr:hypothetical protein [Clostridium beijerinckii]
MNVKGGSVWVVYDNTTHQHYAYDSYSTAVKMRTTLERRGHDVYIEVI